MSGRSVLGGSRKKERIPNLSTVLIAPGEKTACDCADVFSKKGTFLSSESEQISKQILEFAVQVLEFPVQEILEFAVQEILEFGMLDP